MARDMKYPVIVAATSIALVFHASIAAAENCTLSTAQKCSNEEICFALLIDREGSASERETLTTGIPANFLFEIDEAFGKSFAHALSIGASHAASYNTAVQTLDEGEASSFNREAAAMQIDQQTGLVAYSCRSKCSFRPPGVRRPRGFFLPMLNADGVGYRSR